MKMDQPGQIGVAFEQRSQSGFDPPVDTAVGQMPFEQAQYRQSLDYIPQRAGLKNEDLHQSNG
jgi:hypothetical protein